MRNEHLLTEVDHVRLRELLDHLLSSRGANRKAIELLSQRVKDARVVEQRSVPRDVATMNSLIGMRDLDANEKWTCTLAYPHEADVIAHKVSVASPLGAMILGRRIGDTVECAIASGVRRLRIERVYYQPEAAGDYHL